MGWSAAGRASLEKSNPLEAYQVSSLHAARVTSADLGIRFNSDPTQDSQGATIHSVNALTAGRDIYFHFSPRGEKDKNGVAAHDKCGWTALAIAAREGNADIVQILLADARVDPNTPDHVDDTPLIHAAHAGRFDAAQALLADPRTNPALQDKHGWMALAIAARQGNVGIVKMLVADGRVNANTRCSKNFTPSDDGGAPRIQTLLSGGFVQPRLPSSHPQP